MNHQDYIAGLIRENKNKEKKNKNVFLNILKIFLKNYKREL